jgi:GPH family glycoside/pentoside/hexuronide:cation symporter
MSDQHNIDRLSLRTKVAYGVGDLGANLVFGTVGFFLLYFLTDVALLSASLAGIAMMTVRIVDAFTDPLVGYLSDRTRTRWGRRRPFLLFGSLPVGMFFLILFTDTPIQSQALLFVYVVIAYLLFFVSYSAVNVPYSALTPDMTRDFDERTNLTGYRMASAIVGTLIAAGATTALVALFSTERSGFSVVAGLYGAVFIVMTLIVFLGVRERKKPAPYTAGSSMLRLYGSAFKNTPFVLASVTYILHTMAVLIISTTLIYYFKYYMKRESLIGTIFLVLLLTAIVFIPFWVRISRTIGKKASYNIGMTVFALSMVGIFFLRPDQLVAMYLLTAVAGMGLSTNFVLPWAIVPDTIEFNEMKTGNRNEGIFYGIWSFGPKLGSAGSSLLVGFILHLSGYVPNVTDQSGTTLMGIRLGLCIVPAAIMGIGIGVLSFYPITHKKYREILDELARRRQPNA